LTVGGQTDSATQDAPPARGRVLSWWSEWTLGAGCVEAILGSPDIGLIDLAADARRDGD